MRCLALAKVHQKMKLKKRIVSLSKQYHPDINKEEMQMRNLKKLQKHMKC